MKIEKKSTVRTKTVEHVVRGTLEVNFGHFHMSIQGGNFIHLHFDPTLTGMAHIYPPSPDKDVWRKEAADLFRRTIENLKAFDKEQAISELEEAIACINKVI